MQVILWSRHARASSNVEMPVVDDMVCDWFLTQDRRLYRTAMLMRNCIRKVLLKNADNQA